MPISSYSLTPYSGSWTKSEAGHLLRRTTFGLTYQALVDAETNGMSATISALMNIPAIGEPLTFDTDEGIVPLGESWIGSVYPADDIEAQQTQNARAQSMYAWTMERINNEQDNISICEKMALFWNNHFGTTITNDARSGYDYYMLLRNNALGDFKQLVKDVTIHPNMLIFLNGNENSVQSPNENFARELLELFTIGKGPQIGPGDYTNYTEYDISECAKILSGYVVRGYHSEMDTNMYATFETWLHDDSQKTLSDKFNNAIINPNGADEYADLIDVIFLQDEVSKHICRKLYRYFVHPEIDEQIEQNIIEGLASTFRNNNYEIQPVLEQLLSSEHFYDIALRGCIIKSPIEMLFSLWNGTLSKPEYDVVTRYPMLLMNTWLASGMGQNYSFPPSVAGWPAYYQQPAYSQLWLNAALLNARVNAINWLALYSGIESNGERWSVNALGFVKSLPVPNSAPEVIQNMIDLFYPKGTTDSQKDILRLTLTNGLPDFEWTIQYDEHINDPDDENKKNALTNQIKRTLTALFKLPEFQTN
jgi:uncharacterized protein (DUF1800 family)